MRTAIALASADSTFYAVFLCSVFRYPFSVVCFLGGHFSWGLVASQGRGVGLGVEESHRRVMF